MYNLLFNFYYNKDNKDNNLFFIINVFLMLKNEKRQITEHFARFKT